MAQWLERSFTDPKVSSLNTAPTSASCCCVPGKDTSLTLYECGVPVNNWWLSKGSLAQISRHVSASLPKGSCDFAYFLHLPYYSLLVHLAFKHLPLLQFHNIMKSCLFKGEVTFEKDKPQ